MATEQESAARFIATAPSFAICTVCDGRYPAPTEQCTKCKSPLSVVRTCPNCERIVSAKHLRCVYCSTSFVQEDGEAPITASKLASNSIPPRHDSVQKRRAILVSVAVFLAVMFVGLFETLRKIDKSGPEVAASSYVLHRATLRLQPDLNAGTVKTLDSGTVVSLTGLAVSPEGDRWYVLREGNRDAFLKVTDVAPPKVRFPELGSQMLRAWIGSLRDPDLIPEASSAVTYFCARFPDSPHCDELRMMAANQFRSLAQQNSSLNAIGYARQFYQAIIDGKGSSAVEASKALEGLGDDSGHSSPRKRERKARMGEGSYTTGNEYALVDHAEVRVKVPDLNTIGTSESLRAQIASEIRVHGKVAVPSNATCILKVSELGATKQLQVQLTAIEFANKRYNVVTAPQTISSTNTTTIVFTLESSLLIGK